MFDVFICLLLFVLGKCCVGMFMFCFNVRDTTGIEIVFFSMDDYIAAANLLFIIFVARDLNTEQNMGDFSVYLKTLIYYGSF